MLTFIHKGDIFELSIADISVLDNLFEVTPMGHRMPASRTMALLFGLLNPNCVLLCGLCFLFEPKQHGVLPPGSSVAPVLDRFLLLRHCDQHLYDLYMFSALQCLASYLTLPVIGAIIYRIHRVTNSNGIRSEHLHKTSRTLGQFGVIYTMTSSLCLISLVLDANPKYDVLRFTVDAIVCTMRPPSW
jgi:hypothetical protein